MLAVLLFGLVSTTGRAFADDDMARREAIYDDGVVSTLPPLEVDHGVDVWDEARGRVVPADQPLFDLPRNGLNAGPWRKQDDFMVAASVVLAGRSRDESAARVAIFDRARLELSIWNSADTGRPSDRRISMSRPFGDGAINDAFVGTPFQKDDHSYRIASGVMLPGCMLFLMQRSVLEETEPGSGVEEWVIRGVTVAAMQEDEAGEWNWTHRMDMPDPVDPDAPLFQRGYLSSMSAYFPVARGAGFTEAFVPLVDYMGHRGSQKATGGQCGLFRVRREAVGDAWQIDPLIEVHSRWESEGEHFHVAGWTPNGVVIAVGDGVKSRVVLAQCSDWDEYDDPANWTVIPRWQGVLPDAFTQVTCNQFWSCCPGNAPDRLLCGGDNVAGGIFGLDVPAEVQGPPTFEELSGVQPATLTNGLSGNTVSWMHRKAPEVNGPVIARQVLDPSGHDTYSRVLLSNDGENFATVARLPEDVEQYAVPFLLDGGVRVHRYKNLGRRGIFAAAVPSEDRVQAGLLARPRSIDLLRAEDGTHRTPNYVVPSTGVVVKRLDRDEMPDDLIGGLAPDAVCYRVSGTPVGAGRLLTALVVDPRDRKDGPGEATSTAVHLQVCNLLSGKLRLLTRVTRGQYVNDRTHSIVSTGAWNHVDAWSFTIDDTASSMIAISNPVGGEFAIVDFLLVFRSLSEGRGMPSWPLEAVPGGIVPSTRVAQPLGIRGGRWRVGAELQIPSDGLDYSIGTRVESMPLCTFEFGPGRFLTLRSGINNGSILIESIADGNTWYAGQIEDLRLNRGDTINVDLSRRGGVMSISVVAAGSLGETPATVTLPIIHETPPTRFMLGDENHELVSSLILRRVTVDTPRSALPGRIVISDDSVRSGGTAGSTAIDEGRPEIRPEDLVFEIMRGLGRGADGRFDPRDVDGDGTITFLDVRRLLAPPAARGRSGPRRR